MVNLMFAPDLVRLRPDLAQRVVYHGLDSLTEDEKILVLGDKYEEAYPKILPFTQLLYLAGHSDSKIMRSLIFREDFRAWVTIHLTMNECPQDR